MRSTLPLVAILSALLPSAAAIPTNTPIYLADIFHPPSLYLIAFLPGDIPCKDAVMVDQDKPFSIGGTDGIVLKSYWKPDGALMKDGRLFADCHISPDAVIMDVCPAGRRERLTGVVRRTWTCWVVGDGKGGAAGEIPAGEEGGSGTKPGPNRPYWE